MATRSKSGSISRAQPLAKLAYFASRLPLTAISILGYMGTGKTNLARYICILLKRLGFECFYAVVDSPDKVEEALYWCASKRRGDRVFIVFDDASGMLSGKTKRTKKAESALVRARHIVGTGDTGRLTIAVIFHHVGLVNPIFRMTPIYGLTSISNMWEIRLLSREGYFERDKLEEFLIVHTAWMYREKWLLKAAEKLGVDVDRSKPILFRVWDTVEIQWIPHVAENPWDHRLGEPPKTDGREGREPPISWNEFRQLAREKIGIRAADTKLHTLYRTIFYEKLGYTPKPFKHEPED